MTWDEYHVLERRIIELKAKGDALTQKALDISHELLAIGEEMDAIATILQDERIDA